MTGVRNLLVVLETTIGLLDDGVVIVELAEAMLGRLGIEMDELAIVKMLADGTVLELVVVLLLDVLLIILLDTEAFACAVVVVTVVMALIDC